MNSLNMLLINAFWFLWVTATASGENNGSKKKRDAMDKCDN